MEPSRPIGPLPYSKVGGLCIGADRKKVACPMMSALSNRLHARSATLLRTLEFRLARILLGWLLVAGLVSALRVVFAPLGHGPVELGAILPYGLVTLAPFASTLLALRWFRDGDRFAQPATRLAIVGKWRAVEAAEARRHALYGTSGIMVSLLVGILLNVPVRALEYVAVLPPVASTAPQWLLTLRLAMTLDVVLFSSLYMIAFVAALRRVPLFPRLLAAIWIADLAMQVGIAQMLAQEALPATVAAALERLLAGNLQKVLISIALWLPYLLLSKRVNVTYRLRVPA